MHLSNLVFPIFERIHSWYDIGCCSEKDCHPIEACDQLIELPNGAIGYLDQVVTALNVHPSQDAFCHVCIATGYRAGELLCVYVQQLF